MRAISHIYILLFSFVLLTACTKENELDEVVYEIPVEDRFAFAEGDTLLYTCSNQSTDTVFVRGIDFIVETGTYTYLGVDAHKYVTETQSIFIETAIDIWNYEDIDSRCFRMNTLPKYDDINIENFPWCDLLNGCEYAGSRVLAEQLASYEEIAFEGKNYKKVYYQSGGNINNGFEIYWNLKYGIIRFEGVSNGTKLVWQLEGRLE
jgi:hypothetical protein